MGPLYPTHCCCLERQNKAELRGADSPRLSMSHWGRLSHLGGQEPEGRTLGNPERRLMDLF